MIVIYIAGPMSGLPEFNFPAFHAADAALRAAGYKTLNPARRPVNPAEAWADCMRHAIRDVLEAEALAMLPGWETSRGAKLEAIIARNLGLPILMVDMWLEVAADHARARTD